MRKRKLRRRAERAMAKAFGVHPSHLTQQQRLLVAQALTAGLRGAERERAEMKD